MNCTIIYMLENENETEKPTWKDHEPTLISTYNDTIIKSKIIHQHFMFQRSSLGSVTELRGNFSVN